ncbi:enoyl-CoA hydratase/isomerase family protein [Novosphingobium flavum]|uniref:enoyl-CoA hydratase/isomerase family protein n=1 Tax=Novosphingobium aerophilum TaxID=2839843 RepID=UPI00163A703D|nr:enoyl-CoA hydratase/isomerase family protein [Novosphingobium aerophilum]MBC2660356.1 enoyl-CoA hydratase/isomerase family protein [Novosphingobium aerophilum]
MSDPVDLPEPADLAALCWYSEPVPAALVRLDDKAPDALPAPLPAFPVIGLGPGDHPLAAALDLVVDEPEDAALVLRNCARNPEAAAVLVQLLRTIERLDDSSALVTESMAYGLLQGGAEHRDWLANRTAAPAPIMVPGRLEVERSDGLLRLRLDRPAAHNAIDRPLRDALREAFELAALDPDITAVELSGAGRAFSVGAELAEFGTTRDPLRAHAIRLRTLPAWPILACRDRLTARVHGACIGSGLEMAAFAARVIATPDAWFQLPELAMGLIPGAGGCVALSRRIGRARTAWMVLSGRRVPARQALAWGLVDRIER